jgi:diacylglycerol kinase (ATP)
VVATDLWQIRVPSMSTPLVVFINRKSGGNHGATLMHEFMTLLNPIQVFDLADGGPRAGLHLFRDVPRFQVLG